MKYVQRIAAVIHGLENNGRSCDTAWLASQMADVFADAPGFDRRAFMEACDLDPVTVHNGSVVGAHKS